MQHTRWGLLIHVTTVHASERSGEKAQAHTQTAVGGGRTHTHKHNTHTHTHAHVFGKALDTAGELDFTPSAVLGGVTLLSGHRSGCIWCCINPL